MFSNLLHLYFIYQANALAMTTTTTNYCNTKHQALNLGWSSESEVYAPIKINKCDCTCIYCLETGFMYTSQSIIEIIICERMRETIEIKALFFWHNYYCELFKICDFDWKKENSLLIGRKIIDQVSPNNKSSTAFNVIDVTRLFVTLAYVFFLQQSHKAIIIFRNNFGIRVSRSIQARKWIKQKSRKEKFSSLAIVSWQFIEKSKFCDVCGA
jgi:hypothetical protein